CNVCALSGPGCPIAVERNLIMKSLANIKASLSIASLVLFGLARLVAPAQAQTYAITDLGESWPSAINNHGQIVGFTYPTFPYKAIFWDASDAYAGMILSAFGDQQSTAYSINDSGKIAGYYYTITNQPHPMLWIPNGSVTDLFQNLPDTGFAYAINNHDDVVGVDLKTNHGFLLKNGNLSDLNPPSGSAAYAINDNGVIVGSSQKGSNPDWQAVIWENNQITPLSLPAGLSGPALANAINGAKQIVGFVGAAGYYDDSTN